MSGLPSFDLALLAWVSPAYPVGAYAYSHGLEWAVETGDVTNAESLGDWIGQILRTGSGLNDAIFFASAWRACRDDDKSLARVAELAVAFAAPLERRLETLQQGSAFLNATRAAWPAPRLDDFVREISENNVYPICFAAAVAAHGMAMRPALEAYLCSFASNLVSAAVRMNVLGQTEGQKVIARLQAVAIQTAAIAEHASLDVLGGHALRADMAAFHHETQNARLFRS